MRRFLFLLVFLFVVVNTNATHIMGGEITWECIKDPTDPNVGMYVFKMKLYRDCDGVTLSAFAQTLDVWNHPSVTQISVDWVLSADISPDCDVVNSGNVALDCSTNPVGAVEEYIYESQPVALPGIPPANGWHFTWDQCCRNGAISNLILTGGANPIEGFTLRASMFPYLDTNGVALPADPCFDNSPKFNESPQTIICTGYPFSYSHNASDLELDSIVYSWDEPLDDPVGFGVYNPPINPAPIPFVATYAFNNPLPGNPTLNSETGEISYNSNISGNFVTVVRVDAYKCDQIVASIYREIQAVLIACPTLPGGVINSPPVVTPPFPLPNQYYTSVSAGNIVSFNITANDTDLYANGAVQDITLEVSGGQLAEDYITDTLCDNPPCATFVNSSGQAPPIFGAQVVEGYFEWQTACSHVATDAGCGITSNIYTFAVKALDDFCPANAITIATITVEVTAADSLPAPDFDCAWEDENGNIVFNWNHSPGSSSSTQYHIHAASNIGGPYSIVADVFFPNNSFSAAVSSLPAGSEFFYLTSESTCADNSIPSDTISPIKFSVSSTDVNCWDDVDGTISVEVDNYVNVLQYEFSLDGVVNTNAFPMDTVFNGVAAGNHILTVDDVTSGCVIEVPVTILAPGFPLQALVSNSTNTCYGSNLGIAVGSAAGGTPGYSYEWFDSGLNSFSTDSAVFGLSAGSYYLEVMDANGCDTFTIVNVMAPQIPLSASPQLFNVSCHGDATGMIVGDASGSWAPYTYYWLDMNGDTLQQSDPYIFTRDTLFDLLTGSYQLHVVDTQGCTVEYVLNIDEPAVALSIDSTDIISTIACYGDSDGIARLYVSGGDPVYSYLWDNGETGIIASSLTSGYHSVSVIDAWGCEVDTVIEMTENPLIESALVADTTVSCYGEDDGVASISSFGGASSTYTYFWSTGQQTVGVNADTAVGLLHGSYYVTTRDVLGCEVVDSIYISQPEPLIMEASELDWIDCFGYNNGEAFATATGGTEDYTFSWDNTPPLTGDTVYALTPGFHTVVVTDARGCTATDTIETHEPDLLYINILDSQAVLPYCGQLNINTASLSSLAGGGTGSYFYEWNDNPVQPQTTAIATSLTAFNYYNPLDSSYIVTVTDDKGCVASDTTTILQTYTETMEIDTLYSLLTFIGFDTLPGNDISCYGEDDGQALVSADGGHGPYTYQWYGPNGYTSTNDTISNLLAGVYSVYISDTNNCMINSSIVITEPSNIFFVDSAAIDESCLGACDGEIYVNISGGIPPYVAMATETATGSITTTVMDLYNDSVVGGFCSGTYTLTFTDENGCSSTLINGGLNQQTISTNDTTVAQINPNILTILCNGDSTGELTVLDPDTSAGYTYSWQDLNGNVVSNTDTAFNLLAGTYVLYAEYNNISGCVVTDTATVPEESSINPSAVITHVDCYGNSTGVLQGSFQGGEPPHIMLWSTGDLGFSIDSLTAGMYTLTITDSNNCQEVETFYVTQPDSLDVSVDTSISYTLIANPTGGATPYGYSWREASDPSNEIGTAPNYIVSNYGTYYVIITDANGCTVESVSFYFPVPPPPPNSWDCIDDACVDPGDGNGFYSSLSSCEALCLTTDIINPISGDIILNIYPNPFREETTVDFGQTISSATITIVDVYGKMIEIHEVTNTDKYIIKRTNKASGVYFIEIEINQQYLNNIKLVIE